MQNQMSVRQWVFTIILLAIPIVNIIFLIKWGFKGDNPRKNYARGALIVYSCTIGLAILLGAVTTILNLSTVNEYSRNNSNIGDAIIEAKQTVNDWLDEDIEILEVGIEKSDVRDEGIQVFGKLRNNSSDRTHSLMVIKGNAYDEDGSILHTFEIRVEDSIPPGEVYRFSDWTINDDTKSVKIIDVYSPMF